MRLKKFSLVVLGVIIAYALAITINWFSSPNLMSGVYLLKKGGVDPFNNSSYSYIRIPIIWVKKNPFSPRPDIQRICIYDTKNKLIAAIEKGKDFDTFGFPIKWFDKISKPTYIHIDISKWKDKKEGEVIAFKKVELTIDNQLLTYNLGNTYKMINMPYEKINQSESKISYEDVTLLDRSTNDKDVEKAFIFEINSKKDEELKNIVFWFPGMTNEYFKNSISYGDKKGVDGKVVYKRLSLPQKIKKGKSYFKINFTDALWNKGKTFYELSEPILIFKDSKKKNYYATTSYFSLQIFPQDLGKDYSSELKINKVVVMPQK